MVSAVPHLLIAWHSRTGASAAMAKAALAGSTDTARLVAAEDIQPSDILQAAAYLFVCPENLASMSGAMKEMFDRCYYPVLSQIEGRAFATAIAAGSDGEGVQRQIDRIAKGWRLKRVADPLIVITHAQEAESIMAEKVLSESDLHKCRELGQALSYGIDAGIF